MHHGGWWRGKQNEGSGGGDKEGKLHIWGEEKTSHGEGRWHNLETQVALTMTLIEMASLISCKAHMRIVNHIWEGATLYFTKMKHARLIYLFVTNGLVEYKWKYPNIKEILTNRMNSFPFFMISFSNTKHFFLEEGGLQWLLVAKKKLIQFNRSSIHFNFFYTLALCLFLLSHFLAALLQP